MATPIPDNRVPFSPTELEAALGARVDQGAPAVVGVTTDSRKVRPGVLFVALVGEKMDGHAYVKSALEQGAALAVVSREVDDARAIRVQDTLEAWGNLARVALRRWRARDSARRVFMVTGSSGKTTTKEMLKALLAVRKKTSATVGNLNNLIGLPATIFATPDDASYLVLEAGMSVPGEMARLARVGEPDVSTIVNVGIAHAEGVGGREGVFREKSAVYKYMHAAGCAIVNLDDEFVSRAPEVVPARTRVLGYGRGESANHVGYRLVDRALSGTSSELTFTRPLERGGDTVRVTSPFAGEAQALDFLCALACAESVEAPFATDELERALASVELEGRATLRERPDGALVIDDTYNANPASMQSALRMASELAVARNARLVVVLGEMKELGEHAVREHEALGTHVEAAKAALFIGTGGLTEKATARARALGVRVLDAASAEEASMLALREVSAKDVVLVKASRSVRAEQIVHALLSSAESSR